MTRLSDDKELGYFKAKDLVSAMNGCLLLHVALLHGRPLDVIRTVLEANPAAAETANGIGRP